MNTQAAQVLLEKLKALSAERRAEVEDSIDFLQNRETDQQLARSATHARARIQGRLGPLRGCRARPAMTPAAPP